MIDNILKEAKNKIIEFISKDNLLELNYSDLNSKADNDIVIDLLNKIISKTEFKLPVQQLYYLLGDLLSNKEFVYELIKKTSFVGLITYISVELKTDDAFMSSLLHLKPSIFEYCSQKIKDDEEMALYAVKHYNFNIEEVSERLKKDFVFLNKVLENGFKAINLMPYDFLNDKNEMKKLLIKNIKNVEYVSKNLLNDKSFVVEVLNETKVADYYFVKNISDELKNDQELAKKIISMSPYCLKCFLYAIRDNESLVLEAVSRWGYTIRFASERIRNNKEIAIKAIKNDFSSFDYISDELKNDNSILEIYKNTLKNTLK